MVGLDIDSNEDEAKILALLGGGENLLAKRGSKGRTVFFKYNGERSLSWKKDGKVVLELLSDKRLTTIPPAKHRDTGKAYEWINEGSELVDFPAGVLDVFDALYPSAKREYVAPRMEEFEKVDLDDVEEMLSYVSPDSSRDEWLSVGMALRDEFGDAGFALWDGWSSGSSKYKAHEMHNIWRSFNGQGVGIGTLVWLAQESGWVRKVEAPTRDDYDIDLSYLDVKERKSLVAHGLVGEIAEWIEKTAYRPQPQLALGAAISFVGMLKGHKFCTPTGLRTNMLVMNIAPTGGGKEHPQDCIEILAKEMGLTNHLMSEPTAGTSFLKGILDADRVALWNIDELGRYLSHLTSIKSGGYQREILDYVIKSFSKASGVLRGKKFANEQTNPQINIIQPHVCIVGSSVREKIVENCTSSEAIDGFLNRWLLMESIDRPRRRKDVMKKTAVPHSIIEAAGLIAGSPYPIAEDEEPAVKTVRYTPEAYAIMEEYTELIEDLIDTSEHLLQALYVRSCEHMAKLALVLCDNEFIRVEDVELAIEIVTESNKRIVDFASNIADNEQEKNVIRVLNVIKSAGSISHRRLMNNTRFLKHRDRKDIVSDLVQSGSVIAEESGKSYTYRVASA